MNSEISPDHPITKLLFSLYGQAGAVSKSELIAFVDEVGKSRTWLIDPPVVVDVDLGQDGPEKPVGTVGVLLQLYGLPRLPAVAERHQFREAQALVFALRDFTKEHPVMFEVDYGNECIGDIKQGSIDRGIQEAFLDEWERTLDQA